jgi:uncharacterized protein (UPF0548 family)
LDHAGVVYREIVLRDGHATIARLHNHKLNNTLSWVWAPTGLAYLRWLVADLSPRSLGFALGSVHVAFLVDKVALGQVILRVLRFSSVSIIPLWFSILIYNLGAAVQRHSFDPIDMNNRLICETVSQKRVSLNAKTFQ